jgi:hypothetical protein
MRWELISGIRPSFPSLSRCQGQVAHVLLTRSPLGTSRCCHQLALARLACVMHAASVHPEPGSNSPSEISTPSPAVRPRARAGSGFVSHGSTMTTRVMGLTIRPGRTGGMGGTRGLAPCRCRLICCPDVPGTVSAERHDGRARRAVHMTGVGTGFSHTVEFSRNVVGALRRLGPRFPRWPPPVERRRP